MWPPAIHEYFRGGGFSSSYGMRANMPVTMFRINLVKGLGPALQIAEGQFVDLEPEIYRVLEGADFRACTGFGPLCRKLGSR